jgi:hypothetical protein
MWKQMPVVQDKKELEQHFVPGTHMSCVTDYIQVLAQLLGEHLHQTQREAVDETA